MPSGAGRHAHGRGRPADGSLVHGRHPRRSPPYCVRASAPTPPPPYAHGSATTARSRSRRSWSSRCTGPAGSTSARRSGPTATSSRARTCTRRSAMFVARALARAARRARTRRRPCGSRRSAPATACSRAQILGSLDRIRYTAVEIERRRSSGARRAIERVEVADELRPPVDVVLAHELLDNLPFRLVRDGEEVTDRSGRRGLVERTQALDPELRAAVGDRPIDSDLVVPTGATRVHRSSRGLARSRGYALLIDYGGDASGPVHGYRRHSPWTTCSRTPGSVDVTAGVDFSWIADHARTPRPARLPARRPDRRAARTRLRVVAPRRARRRSRTSSRAARASTPCAPGRCARARRCWSIPPPSGGCGGCSWRPRASPLRRG